MSSSNLEFWEQRYIAGTTPWDFHVVLPALYRMMHRNPSPCPAGQFLNALHPLADADQTSQREQVRSYEPGLGGSPTSRRTHLSASIHRASGGLKTDHSQRRQLRGRAVAIAHRRLHRGHFSVP